MVANLTEAQLIQMRADLDDVNDTPAFSDDELQSLWAFEAEDWNKTMVHCIEQLMMSASKFSDYTQNQTQEKKSTIFSQLKVMRDLWQKKVDSAIVVEQKSRPTALTNIRPIWRQKRGPYA